MPLAKGDRAPIVKLRDFDSEVSIPSVGTAMVIFFYPTNQGSTCVTEVVDFESRLAEFAALGVRVVGVTTEGLSKVGFLKDSKRLSLTLCHDPGGLASALYGVKNAYGFSDRYTFLVSKDGVIQNVWQAYDTQGHAEAVLRYCRELLAK
jgi:peroxiredoxin Q/BCP